MLHNTGCIGMSPPPLPIPPFLRVFLSVEVTELLADLTVSLALLHYIIMALSVFLQEQKLDLICPIVVCVHFLVDKLISLFLCG